MTTKNLLPLLLLSVLLSGCKTTITNLTPNRLPRNPEGLYHFEVALDSNQKTLREETIQAYVLIGLDAYPMQPTALVQHRWETFIPIPPERDSVNYSYKFDYQYFSIPERRKSSRLTPNYHLQITDK